MLNIEFDLLEKQIKTLTLGTENLDNCLEPDPILASDFRILNFFFYLSMDIYKHSRLNKNNNYDY